MLGRDFVLVWPPPHRTISKRGPSVLGLVERNVDLVWPRLDTIIWNPVMFFIVKIFVLCGNDRYCISMYNV